MGLLSFIVRRLNEVQSFTGKGDCGDSAPHRVPLCASRFPANWGRRWRAAVTGTTAGRARGPSETARDAA